MLSARRRHSRAVALIAALAVATGLAACGSSSSAGPGATGTTGASSDPRTLVKQSFQSTRDVKSGVVKFSLVVTPAGSALITTPLTLTFSGPFQARASGKPPESALTVAFSGLGQHGSAGVTTTASGAYITLQGSNYRLPATKYDKLVSSLSNGSGGTPGFSTLGIDPSTWLSNPQVVGTETVDGTTTEHVHSAVDVPALIASVNKLLVRESSVIQSSGGIPAPHISAPLARKAAAAIHDPTFDIYTGKDDSIPRRIVIAADVPVTGTISTQLGGLTSASVKITVDYTDLNQPQTIATPTNVKSYQALQTELQSIFQQLGSVLGGGLGGASATNSTNSPSSAQVAKYSTCVSAAQGDAVKTQRCAHLLQSAQ